VAHDDLAAEILTMAERDQAMRKAAMSGAARWDRELDRANTERLRAIVAVLGWPTRSRVGERAEHAAWLLAQHADHDIAFQRSVLELMTREPETEVCPKHLAYLEDRINVSEGRPQRYGTQLRGTPEAGYRPAPLADDRTVDELRRRVGLDPLAEYVARVARRSDG
jgi:hypothetical protein